MTWDGREDENDGVVWMKDRKGWKDEGAEGRVGK